MEGTKRIRHETSEKTLASFWPENYSLDYLMPKATHALILQTSKQDVIAVISLHAGETINPSLSFKLEFLDKSISAFTGN